MPRPVPSTLWTIKRVAGTNPGANVEILDAVPAGKTWELLGVMLTCVQGITQTPQPILQIDDGTNNVIELLASSAAQAVSTTCVYQFSPDLPLLRSLELGAAGRSDSWRRRARRPPRPQRARPRLPRGVREARPPGQRRRLPWRSPQP